MDRPVVAGVALNMHGLSALILLLVRVATARPYEGDECRMSSGPGVCRRISQCPEAVHRLLQGSMPTRCGFLGFQEVVCCPKPGKPKTVIGSRISQTACQDYQAVSNEIPQFYILNGTDAEEEEFPHMAALGYAKPGAKELSWVCGGSLISDQFVLTAAHCCTNPVWKYPVRIQLGRLSLSSSRNSGQYDVDRIIVHPGFKSPSLYNDIALVKLSRKVTFSTTVTPACLFHERNIPQEPLTATGWGAVNSANTRTSKSLMKTEILMFPTDKCSGYYGRKYPQGLDSSVFCAGDPNGVTDTCGGDSGGPLQIRTDNLYSIVGITSLGPNPCGGSIPSIYVRVSHYLDWIESHVWR